jgi:hypothetical protein
MIPYLVVIAIGLPVLHLIALAVGSRHVPVTRRPAGMVGAPAEAGCGVARGIDAALRAGS